MVRARRLSADKTDFADFDQARRWFAAQPREVCAILAARMALRILPAISGMEVRNKSAQWDFLVDLALPMLRAASASWTVARYPAQFRQLQGAAHAAAAAASGIG